MSIFKNNLVAKTTSLIFSILIWLIITSQKNFEVVTEFEIKIKTNRFVMVQDLSSSKVELHLSGPKDALKTITLGTWPREIFLDLQDFESGYHQVFLDPLKVPLPPGVELRRMSPRSIQVNLHAIK